MSKWVLDELAKKPHFRRAFEDFERREGRPVRLGPLPEPKPIHAFRVTLAYDGRPCLTLAFQSRPPDLAPGDLFNSALRHLAEFPRGTLEQIVLATFCEFSQDWPRKGWSQVLAQLRLPVQECERVLVCGFTVPVARMRG